MCHGLLRACFLSASTGTLAAALHLADVGSIGRVWALWLAKTPAHRSSFIAAYITGQYMPMRLLLMLLQPSCAHSSRARTGRRLRVRLVQALAPAIQ